MSWLLRKTVSLAMLAVFMASVGAWSLNSKWLAHAFEHELEHGQQLAFAASIDHADAHQLKDSGAPDKESLNDSEHRLVHAVDHIQPFPIPTLNAVFAHPPRSIHSSFAPQAVPLAEFEAPFRPPRSTSFLA